MAKFAQIITKVAHFLGTPAIGAVIAATTYTTSSPETTVAYTFSVVLASIAMNLLTQKQAKSN